MGQWSRETGGTLKQFFVKGQRGKVAGFAGCTVSVTVAQSATDSMQMNGHGLVTIKLYKNRNGDWIRPGGHGLPTPLLEDKCKHSWWFLMRLFIGLHSAWTCITFYPGGC